MSNNFSLDTKYFVIYSCKKALIDEYKKFIDKLIESEKRICSERKIK